MEVQKTIDYIDSIVRLLRRYHFSNDVAVFIGSQFALESDFGRSNLAQKYNNHCGMKCPLVRVSIATNYGLSTSRDEFAHYTSLAACVEDYILWVAYNRPYSDALTNLDSYVAFVKRVGYCPAKDYVSRIMRIYNNYYQYSNL